MSEPECDDSVWGIAGNVVEERAYGPGGTETRHGTRLLRPGAKVYLASIRHHRTLFDAVDGIDESLLVVGQHRKSRQWLTCWIRSRYVTNWRLQLVYDPGALSELREAGWCNWAPDRGSFECPPDERQGEAAVRGFLDQILGSVRGSVNADKPAVAISPYAPRWVRCPGCGIRFALSNPGSWSGERHLACGQALRVE